MKKCTLLAGLLMVLPAVGWSQSKIQCVQSPDGRLQAAQIWQNTLGVARANEICSAMLRTSEPLPDGRVGESKGRFDDSTYAEASKQHGGKAGGAVQRPSAGLENSASEAPDIPVGFERIW